MNQHINKSLENLANKLLNFCYMKYLKEATAEMFNRPLSNV